MHKSFYFVTVFTSNVLITMQMYALNKQAAECAGLLFAGDTLISGPVQRSVLPTRSTAMLRQNVYSLRNET